MMKSNYLWMVAIAAALTGCAKDSDLADNPVNPASPTKNNTETVAKQPVLFGAYVNRATTRAGDPGVLVTSGATAGQINLQEKGFGVIAYYTDDYMYSPIYHCSSTYRDSGTLGYFLKVNEHTNANGSVHSTAGSTRCYPVRLVKQATGPAPEYHY